MSAVGFTENLAVDDPRSLIDARVPRPTAGPRDLIVRVQAVSVNPVDTKVRAGMAADGLRVLGFDAAGTVVETGSDATLFSVGDEVYYAGTIERAGTDAELHAVDERLVGHKPRTLSFAQAAALPLTTITAWEGLFDKLKLTETSHGTLFVPGASGGVGSMVLQLAKELLPQVRTIATSSRPETDRWVQSMGADDIVNHRADLRAELAGVAPSGVDWVFTSHVEGEGQLALYVDVLKPFGEIVAIDDPESLDVVALKTKSLSLHWEFMFARAISGGDAQLPQHELLDRVADLVDAGRIRSTVTEVLSPIDASTLRQAHARIEDGHVIGKIVLEVAQPAR